MFRSARWRALLLVAGVALSGCKKAPLNLAPPLEDDALVQLVRTREVPDPAQARFTIKMHSKPLGIAAPPLGGGLVVDRPGRAHIAILLPTGSPVVTLSSDGQRVVFLNTHDQQYVTADDAAALLGNATGGAFSLDDVTALLLGLLPIESSHVRTKQTVETGVEIVYDGPAGTTITAVVDPSNGTPVHVSLDDAKGRRAVEASYDPFEEVSGFLLPARIELDVPSVELTVELKFKTWTLPTEVPDVFSPPVPEGYTVMTMDAYRELMAKKLADKPRSEDPPPPEPAP